jgi:hypothetical protein
MQRQHSHAVRQQVISTGLPQLRPVVSTHPSRCADACAPFLRLSVNGPQGCITLIEAHRARLAELIPATGSAAGGGDEDEDDEEALGALRVRRSALGRDLVATAGRTCRASSQAYLEAINQMQRLDSYDPFMHREWALLLQARGGRDAEVLQHLTVAVALFEHATMAATAGVTLGGAQMPAALSLKTVPSEAEASAWRREAVQTRMLLPAEHQHATPHGEL